jgi:Arc/MetJ family transcription regulator
VAFFAAATSLFEHGEAEHAGTPCEDRDRMIFKGVRDGKPYPDHGLSYRDWSHIPPRQIRLDELVTTTTVLALDRLLSEDSTFYGDLFPHAVKWKGVLYLEDGLHRAVRAALRNRVVLHARLFDMDAAVRAGA